MLPSLCKVISHTLQNKSNTILQNISNHIPAILSHTIGFATDTITEAPKYFPMVKETDLSLLQNVQTISGPTQPPILGVLVFFHWGKASKALSSPLTTILVPRLRISVSHTCTNPILRLQGVDRDFTFYNILYSTN